jgi:nitrogen fixation protein NifX
MSPQAISRDVALRIGMAARVLPEVDPRRLIEVLVDRLGSPLTEKRLAKITVTDLKTGLGSLDGEEDGEDISGGVQSLKLAVRYLWGEEDIEPKLPAIQAYQEGEMPGSIRVACASNSGGHVDGHFGSCPRFLVYQVSTGETRLVDIRSTEGADSADDKNAFRANLIADCHVLYVQSIGGPAAAKVVRASIHPIKVPEGGDAVEVISRLQEVLGGTPPPWLAKVMGVEAQERARFAAGGEA